jgi:gamma-glutamylcyclotransferase (GGCT)/AIG2-like uncharacterized protein YtfP
MPLLFVYGTLMRGESNHGQLEAARFAGAAQTAPAFTLVDLGPYPAMVAGGRDAVAGELYEVDDAALARLDLFEGPALYARTRVHLDDGREAHAYLLPRESLRGGRPIGSGDWRRREG